MDRKSPLKFFSGTASTYLAEKIAKSYGTELGSTLLLRFSDGEFQPSYLESVRGCTVFIIQSTFPPAENLFELLLMIDAAKRASAKRIVPSKGALTTLFMTSEICLSIPVPTIGDFGSINGTA